MVMLTLIEVPLATAPITLFLGHSLFMEKPRAGQIVKEFFQSLPQMLLFQVILRIPLLFIFVTWIFLFGAWPYMNEVILLERNPLFRRRPGQMTTFRRIRALHGGVMGDLFPRWLASMVFGADALRLAVAVLLDALRHVVQRMGMGRPDLHLLLPALLVDRVRLLRRGPLFGLSRSPHPPRRLGSGTPDAPKERA